MKTKKLNSRLNLGKKQISNLSKVNGGVAIPIPVRSNLPRCVSGPPGSCLCMTYEECEKTEHEALPL